MISLKCRSLKAFNHGVFTDNVSDDVNVKVCGNTFVLLHAMYKIKSVICKS